MIENFYLRSGGLLMGFLLVLRWADETKRHQLSWMPFGAGPRTCIGMRFAQLEEKLALAHIFRKYKIERHSKTEVHQFYDYVRYISLSDNFSQISTIVPWVNTAFTEKLLENAETERISNDFTRACDCDHEGSQKPWRKLTLLFVVDIAYVCDISITLSSFTFGSVNK